MEWAKERSKLMTDEEAYALAVTLRAGRETTTLEFDEPDWVRLEDDGRDVFDLANGGRPLWFHLDSNGVRHVQVTFRPFPENVPPVSTRESLADDDRPVPETTAHVTRLAVVGRSSSVVVFRRRVYAAKFNVHVGQFVLHRFHVLGFVDETSA